MDRRSFLSTTALAAVAVPLAAQTSAGGPAAAGLIDTNVYLADWVVRRSQLDSPAALVRKLRHHGVSSAWTGSFEGVLHSDIAGVNARLAEACARDGGGVLRAFGTVNPTLPDWEEDVRRCHEVHRMPGVRLFPNYHGYALDDPRFARLLDLAAQAGLLVQIALSIEDERSQNPLLAAAAVQAAPLPDVLAKVPRARVMLLNGGSRVLGNVALLQRLAQAGVLLEVATLEGVAGIEALLQKTPGARLAFGSHTPYFYFEAALLKLQESALTREQLAAIRNGNARAALALSP
jgi:uncharacterized protein